MLENDSILLRAIVAPYSELRNENANTITKPMAAHIIANVLVDKLLLISGAFFLLFTDL